MILGLGRHNRRPSREQLEQEAADIIAERVAAGRPPPEVWLAAERWRAANPPSGTSWYSPEEPTPVPSTDIPTPVVSPALLPRVVRMPAGAPQKPTGRTTTARRSPAETV